MNQTFHIASCSFGKDSLATILVALEHGDPIDRAVFSEVMYDRHRDISGENPEHIDFIRNTAIPKLASFGVPVDVVRAQRDFIDYFFQRHERGNHVGMLHGFPIGGMCKINSDCKVKPIREYLREYRKRGNVVQYIGIAIDEPKRLARLNGDKVSLLAKYNITEKRAREICEANGLLSPIYKSGTRGGCWFCPNQKICDFNRFRAQYPQLWGELKQLSRVPFLTSPCFKYDMTFDDVENKMNYEQSQLKLF